SAKKLFATDFDGTLSQYPHGVTQEYLDRITEFRAAGNVFGIVTGRTYSNADFIIKDYLKYCDFIMCMTGALAIDSKGKTIFEYQGDGAVLPEILRTIAELGTGYLFFADGRESYRIDLERPLDDSHEGIVEAKRHRTFTQINACFDPEDHFRYAVGVLEEKYGDKISLNLNGHCVDIPPYGVDKGVTVARIADHFGVAHENVYTAGDNDNDVPMIRRFNGYTVPHGSEACRDAAKKIMINVGDMLEDVMKNG
ncbi:MAG: HAD hydrolase family protein, partial [Clostridia bacterium]|nr:HAD hydrolase family protein [Clostridia bacterium]